MGNLAKEKSEELPPSTSVSGSAIFRMVPPEDQKKIKDLAKKIARKHGLIVTVIEK